MQRLPPACRQTGTEVRRYIGRMQEQGPPVRRGRDEGNGDAKRKTPA
jgi:hypothetical protein